MEVGKLKKDLEDLSSFASKNGATEVKVIESSKVVVDERVQLKCAYPPCIYYGKSLMCPPYTPKAKDFREIVKKYDFAIAAQITRAYDDELKKYLNVNGAKFQDVINNPEFQKEMKVVMDDVTKRLRNLIASIEREAFSRGYYLSIGLGSGTCLLCETCELKYPCKHPWEARPSMEAMGIDITRTMRNAGLQLTWNSGEKITLNCLVLIG